MNEGKRGNKIKEADPDMMGMAYVEQYEAGHERGVHVPAEESLGLRQDKIPLVTRLLQLSQGLCTIQHCL